MTSTLRLLTLLLAAAGLMAVTGCKTVSISTYQYVGGPIYAPTDPNLVVILNTQPTRPNVRLGEVTAEPSSDQVSVEEIQQKLRQAAAKMGADAVVIVSDRYQVTGAVVSGGWMVRSVQPTMSRVVVGVAIKYLNP
jgi:hypothetical protein